VTITQNDIQNYIGCDTSKRMLDIFDPLTRRLTRVDNNEPGLEAFVQSLIPGVSFVVFEATGHCDRLLRIALGKAGISYARLNPVMVRRYAQAKGRLAKTDRLDARILSQFGASFKPEPDQPIDLERETLAALARRRDQLIDMRAKEKKHLPEIFDDMIKGDVEASIASLNARIGALETEIQRNIQSTQAFATQNKRLCSAPGIGKVTALTLMALMPELGHITPKAIAALAGLAPMNNDSGRRTGKRTIKGGRSRVRKALYMAALSAIKASARFKTFYQAIATRSGSKKLAIVATARKLLTVLNAMERTKNDFA
jgi:transposase